MRSAYRILAFVIAAEVIIQAAAIGYAIFGLGAWIQSGGVLGQGRDGERGVGLRRRRWVRAARHQR
jgi:hypothetical protein